LAENGKVGLEKLRTRSFDLVLLDIEMPEMDGFQVLEACLNDTDLRNIPIIMTSSMEELDSVVKCIELGAEDYLNKPVNPVLLRARINASLEKKRLRDEQRKLFRTFATEEVADQLSREGFSLGGKHVHGSAMFTDIRSFTTLAETQDPADTIDLLNSYYALMFEAITGHGGTVNQMLGDGIMAIFGAPTSQEDHAERAVRAALEMIDLIEGFNQQQVLENKSQINIGIGIASGQMIAGFTGTQNRATYTCVGDTVNLAARIEDYTKQAGKLILFDKFTREGLPGDIEVEELGEVFFKGKQQAVKVFAIRNS
jgi:class 3 adenylate cyclase